MNLLLKSEAETLELGAKLFSSMQETLAIYLHGDLGTGKTTLVRGFLRAGGFTGPVKSPTFTLVEEYRLSKWRIAHFDLYRLTDPEELEWIGIRDYFEVPCVCFIEWPGHGSGFLARPDVSIFLQHDGASRTARLQPNGPAGTELVERL